MENCMKEKIHLRFCSLFIKKTKTNLHISGLVWIKLMLFKEELYLHF